MARTRSLNLPNTLLPWATIVDKIQRMVSNFLLNSGVLVIKAEGSKLAAFGTAINYMVDGKVFTAAGADCAALAGTVTADKFNVFVFSINSAGTMTTQMGTEAATLGGVVFPEVADGNVMIGFVIVNPTGTGNFVGGTTPLDDATVVPNAVYVNTPFPCFPEFAAI